MKATQQHKLQQHYTDKVAKVVHVLTAKLSKVKATGGGLSNS